MSYSPGGFQDPALPKVGDVVGDRYRITGVLGAGGMGIVFRAVQEPLDRPVAVKVVHPEHARREKTRARFLREARVAAALHHEGAVEIYDFGAHGETLYLAMQMLDGAPLRAVVDFDLPPLDVKRTCRIGRQVADVLAAAAAIGLVHRDLKPENIMLEPSVDGGERVVVVDFGLAFLVDDEGGASGRLTKDGVVSGTPDYMSPEQVRGAACTPAADIYALGLVLYEMLTSESPLAKENPAITLTRQLFTMPAPIREAFPSLDVPAALDELVLSMLAKRAQDRPAAQTVRDVLMRIELGDRERMGATTHDGQAVGRSARMLSRSPTQNGDEPKRISSFPRHGGVEVVGGVLDVEALTGLAFAGMTPQAGSSDGAQVVIVLDGNVETVRARAAAGLAVVVSVDPKDTERMVELMRAGATEVVPIDATPDVLVKRVARALKKAQRPSGDPR